ASVLGFRINGTSQYQRGIMYSNSAAGRANTFWGVGAELTSVVNNNSAAGYVAYRLAGVIADSSTTYGLYGINGTAGNYATGERVWALFSRGRAVISGEVYPTAPLGVD